MKGGNTNMDLLEAKRILHPDTTEQALTEIRQNELNVMDKINEALRIACDCIDQVIMWNERMTDDGR